MQADGTTLPYAESCASDLDAWFWGSLPEVFDGFSRASFRRFVVPEVKIGCQRSRRLRTISPTLDQTVESVRLGNFGGYRMRGGLPLCTGGAGAAQTEGACAVATTTERCRRHSLSHVSLRPLRMQILAFSSRCSIGGGGRGDRSVLKRAALVDAV